MFGTPGLRLLAPFGISLSGGLLPALPRLSSEAGSGSRGTPFGD